MSSPKSTPPRLKTHEPPLDTKRLREALAKFLNQSVPDHGRLGSCKHAIYAFFDYDGEPIYVGQTNEQLRVRIRRHLTNHRTDAVAMSVLDPFEVLEIQVWPLPQFQSPSGKKGDAKAHLNALESIVVEQEIEKSRFFSMLNEKDPPLRTLEVEVPPSFRARIVSDRLYELRSHPDSRMARRAMVTARLAQVISEREVKAGLRRALVTQTKRLQWLAERRFEQSGGAQAVEREDEEASD